MEAGVVGEGATDGAAVVLAGLGVETGTEAEEAPLEEPAELEDPPAAELEGAPEADALKQLLEADVHVSRGSS